MHSSSKELSKDMFQSETKKEEDMGFRNRGSLHNTEAQKSQRKVEMELRMVTVCLSHRDGIDKINT